MTTTMTLIMAKMVLLITKGIVQIVPRKIKIRIPSQRQNLRNQKLLKGWIWMDWDEKGIFLEVTDYIILTFFTLELCARLVTCPSIFRYYKSPLNTLDTLVLILAFIEIAVMQISLEEKFKSKGLKVLLYFQILRIFRVFRIVKNVTAIKVLVFSFRTSYKDFMVLLLYVCIALTLFGSAFYFVEDSRHIQNIPEAVWLTLITMTTVGYGDLYPKSLPGRILGGMCALTGVLLFGSHHPCFCWNFC